MQTNTVARPTRPPQWGLAVSALFGLAIAAALAAYASVHPGHGQALFTLGFTAILPMKAWLTTAAGVLIVVQVISALGMWGKLPGVKGESHGLSLLHRWSGTVAFVLTIPVAFQCVWSLGFSTAATRTIVHSIAGCLFYGIFGAKMLGLRLKGLPGWALPVLGGLLAAAFTTLWFTAAFWFFTTPGLPRF